MGSPDQSLGSSLEERLAQTTAERDALRVMLRSAPDLLAHLLPDGRLLYLNRELPGIDARAPERHTVFELLEPGFHQAARDALARAVSTRQPASFESTGTALRPGHHFTRIAPVVAGEQVSALVLISTDVGTLKEARAIERAGEEMLRFVLAATGMGTWWWDRDLKQVGYDELTSHLFGREHAAIVPLEGMMAALHPDDRARVAEGIERSQTTGVYGPLIHRVVWPDGTVRTLQADGRMLRDTRGRQRLVGGVVDITERLELEAQLGQARKMESVGRLAGGIAHDFNNMLTAILSYSELAMAAVPTGTSVHRDLVEVHRAAERSATLTAQLLAFSRQQVIEPKVVDPNAMVAKVDGLLRRLLGAHLEVKTSLRAQGQVRVDVNQFELVLVNLATNARDAMTRGGTLTIETYDLELDGAWAQAHPGFAAGWYVVLAMTDTGEGIAPEHLPHLFEPFFTTRPQGKGTGLGLATSYGIVTQNDGHLLVDSELGRGSSFRIYLPLVRGQPMPAAAATAANATSASGHETVLVVEDEPTIRNLEVLTLKHEGYVVLEAGNGVEALAVARAHPGEIALLVSDVVMPQMGGKQLAASLKAIRPTLKVLFTSGYPSDFDLQTGPSEDEGEFLSKPFVPKTLVERVRRMLDRRPAAPAASR